ncbi:laminin G domain-containing protein [Luteolibacter marinus]|uniref:laminin G domain-containing protein n=1 Tax=Luteolibacter marinus TaxID=2776705 RepID=UPI0018689CF7|nr:laminin G domain-containing protein [Luteolibacter marinus]
MKLDLHPIAGIAVASGMLAPTALADLRPPYTADSKTAHLYHFDEAAGGSAAANSGNAGLNAITTDVNPATGATVTTVLGATGYSGFGNAANFGANLDQLAGFDANSNGTFEPDQSGAILSPDAVNLSSLGLGGANPFTLEALVYTNSATGNRHILCTDSSAANRGFQFRITTGGTTGQRLEFNQITNGGQRFGEIPNTGDHAFATGQWFHAAFVYDGTNCQFYWTKVDPATTAVNPIGEPQALALNAAVGGYTGPLVIGNENRNVAGEGINGQIDEVRISTIARGPSYFLFIHDTEPDGLDDNWELSYAATLGELSGLGGADADGDGVSDLDEYLGRSNPKDILSTPSDIDGDLLPDAWEITHFGNTTSQTGAGDPDNDYATNAEEYAASSLPLDRFSFPDAEGGTGDGMCDPWESYYFGSTAVLPDADADGDTFSNLDEFLANSHPDDIDWTPEKAKLRHRWSFNGNLDDSVGGSTVQLIDPDGDNLAGGNSTLSSTDLLLDGGDRATSVYAQLGSNLLQGLKTPVTIELWGTQVSVKNWSRIFDFGSSTGEYMFMSWTQGTAAATDRVGWTDIANSLSDNTNQPYTVGTEHHIVMTIEPGAGTNSGTLVTWYSRPVGTADLAGLRGSFTTTNQLSQLNDLVNNLGRSQFTNDNTANARYNEFRIWNGALTYDEREFLHDAGPTVISADDSDGDNLPDAWEIANFREDEAESEATILAKYGEFDDPDGDLYDNFSEFRDGTDPNDVFSSYDSDADGLPDGYEVFWFRDFPGEDFFDIIAKYTAADDVDLDGFTNGQERVAGSEPGGTNPNLAAFTPIDTDGDGLIDSWELFYFLDLDETAAGQSDGDGFDNLAEQNAGSNPTLTASTPSDTDGNGTADASEALQPYAVDSNTLHLWHLDAVKAPAPDAVGNDLPLTNLANGALLWSPSLPAFGTGLNPSANRGTANGGVLSALPLVDGVGDDASLIYTGAAGEFSFEAVVRIDFDPTVATPSTAPMQIVTGESDAGASRVWQFRIVPIGGPGNVAGTTPLLEFINLHGEVGVQSLSAPLPSGADPNAIAQGQWFHVAVTYNGSENTAGNLKLYWTAMNPARTQANAILSAQMTDDLISAAPDFTIGNEGRSTGGSTDGFVGVIDEVRISSIARPASGFHFSGADDDNIDDDWELLYFGDLDESDGGDFDHDGTDNLTEYRLGLIPNNGSSRFAATRAAGGEIQWPSVVGVTFKIERSTTLTGTWDLLQATFPGTAGTASFTDPAPPAGKAFYRITLND